MVKKNVFLLTKMANKFGFKMKYIIAILFSQIFIMQIIAQVASNHFTAKYVLTEQREKIIIQTNQQLYMRGDTIWFKCNLVDGYTHIPSTSPLYPKNRSAFVYIELHDCQSDTLISRYKVKADSLGVFSNGIAIPRNVSEGYYMLVAYTKWMMNFDESNFAYHEIYIAGKDGKNRPLPAKTEKVLHVSVFPEGGCLLTDHLQNVTFQITNSENQPLDAEIRLINMETDSIMAYTHTELTGLGQLHFIPEKGVRYSLEAYTTDGLSGSTEINQINEEGACLQLLRRKNHAYVNIINNHCDVHNLLLMIYNNGKVTTIHPQQEQLILDTNSFDNGIVTLSLIDSSKNDVLSTRSFYVK